MCEQLTLKKKKLTRKSLDYFLWCIELYATKCVELTLPILIRSFKLQNTSKTIYEINSSTRNSDDFKLSSDTVRRTRHKPSFSSNSTYLRVARRYSIPKKNDTRTTYKVVNATLLRSREKSVTLLNTHANLVSHRTRTRQFNRGRRTVPDFPLANHVVNMVLYTRRRTQTE